MTRLSSTSLKALLLIACSALYAGAASAVPAIWEAQLGATVTSAAAAPALDDQDNLDTGIDLSFGSMSFPFPDPTQPSGVRTYTGADVLNISSNGFISLGGSNGSDPAPSVLALTTDTSARIAPFWTNLNPGGEGGDIFINRFDDNGDTNTDRIVITFATGVNDCIDEECRVLAQVQLIEDGTIIFGYNGIDLDDTASAITADLLIGVSPGNGVAAPLLLKDFSADLPFPSAAEPTVFELFSPATGFDLDDSNIIFIANKTGGFFLVTDDVSSLPAPPVSTEPQEWETRIGATLDMQALDGVDDGSVNINLGTMTFPFAGTDYSGTDLWVSSNGFISLGGDNGDGCIGIVCEGNPTLLASGIPRIMPFWTDLDPGDQGGDIFINRFDDSPPAGVDRIVITFATGHDDCAADECHVLVQVQLKDDGTIIFGYNGIALTDSVDDDVLVGIADGTTASGSTDFVDTATFNSGTDATIYELFVAASAPPVDLDGGNLIFTPNGGGGFILTAPGLTGTAVGGIIVGGSNGSGHCSLAGDDAPFEPTLWLMVLASLVYLGRRRLRAGPAR